MLKKLDWPLLSAVCALLFLGILNIYGIGGFESVFLKKQAVFALIGALLVFISVFFDYRIFKNYSVPSLAIYAFVILLLLATLFTAPEIRGVTSWLFIGRLGIEPSEVLKLSVLILLAKYFSSRHTQIDDWRHILASFIYIGVPAFLIFIQPDFGSAAIVFIIWLGSLVIAGIRPKYLTAIILIFSLLFLLGWNVVLKPYQKARLVTFLNPSRDPKGAGYNVIQSKIAVGSGKFFGKGLGNPTQAKLGLLPEPYTDFAFASLVEQFGFVGMVFILMLYLLVLSRLIKISLAARDNFSKIYLFLFAVFIFAHVVINIGMNMGLMPITGLPLPFISYGGSHLITLMLGIGIVQSIKARV